MRKLTGALVAAAWMMLLLAPPASSARVIEWWRVGKEQPPEKVQPPPSSADQTPPGPVQAAPETTPPEGAAADTRQAKLAQVLRDAATRSGLAPAGEAVVLSADDLKPPPAESEPAGTKGEAPATAGAAPGPAPASAALPGILSGEAVMDYEVVALAAADFTHPKGQTVRSAIVEMSKAAEAWGLFSRNRGEEPLVGLGQAANFGRGLRLWKGCYAILLAVDPPDPVTDKIRLSKLGRDICAMLQGGGSPPTMAGWLPTGNQLAYTAVYFHADGPIAADSLGLGAGTEGVAAEYQAGENSYGGLIVRYLDQEAALAGWRAFVEARVGGGADTGTPGSRRLAPEAGRWNGTRVKGRACAFVVGAATRNQAEILLAQALGQAHD